MILSLFLTACASQAAIPTATAIALPSATSSPKPTFTPTETLTPTITPTPLPPTPKGAEKFDSSRKLWDRKENGTVSYYIPETDGWATALNQRPIYLVSAINYSKDVVAGLPASCKSMSVYYYRMPDSEQPFFTVEKSPSYDKGWFGDTYDPRPNYWHSLPTEIAILLAERFNGVERSEVTMVMLRDSVRKVCNHSLALALDIPTVAKDNSKVTTKYWDPDNNIDIVQVSWNSTQNDPSFFGQLSLSLHWKLDVRGGEDRDHPGTLVVIYATPYEYRFRKDIWEAVTIILGPASVAILSQKEPLVDFVSYRADDLNNFMDEARSLHRSTGMSYDEMYGPFSDFDPSKLSISAAISNPFFNFKCIHFEKDGSQTIIDCYQIQQ